jgi:dihydrolipoamide dehydrogenase
VFEQVNHLADYGLKADGLGFDFGKIVARSRASAAQLSKGVAFLMRKNKIEVIDGAARLEPGDKAPTVVVALKAGRRAAPDRHVRDPRHRRPRPHAPRHRA